MFLPNPALLLLPGGLALGLALLQAGGGAATAAPPKQGVEWAGESALSSLVNGLIRSPLYILMKRGARDTLIRSAERSGVRWRDEACPAAGG